MSRFEIQPDPGNENRVSWLRFVFPIIIVVGIVVLVWLLVGKG